MISTATARKSVQCIGWWTQIVQVPVAYACGTAGRPNEREGLRRSWRAGMGHRSTVSLRRIHGSLVTARRSVCLLVLRYRTDCGRMPWSRVARAHCPRPV